MKKSDLRTGMKVAYRNGKIRYVIGKELYDVTGSRVNGLRSYNDDLTDKDNETWNDIVKVYVPARQGDIVLKSLKAVNYEIVWDREPLHELKIDGKLKTVSHEKYLAIKDLLGE